MNAIARFTHMKDGTLPLSFFEPMMERLFAHPRNSIYKAAMEEHSPA